MVNGICLENFREIFLKKKFPRKFFRLRCNHCANVCKYDAVETRTKQNEMKAKAEENAVQQHYRLRSWATIQNRRNATRIARFSMQILAISRFYIIDVQYINYLHYDAVYA
jgi:hypothetical protein